MDAVGDHFRRTELPAKRCPPGCQYERPVVNKPAKCTIFSRAGKPADVRYCMALMFVFRRCNLWVLLC